MTRRGEPHVNMCCAGFDGDEIVFADVADGGALRVMDHLAQWYIGPGAKYPARDMPAGWSFRVSIDKLYGQGLWNDRWVEMDRASREAKTG
jgi:hypothetical protein